MLGVEVIKAAGRGVGQAPQEDGDDDDDLPGPDHKGLGLPSDLLDGTLQGRPPIGRPFLDELGGSGLGEPAVLDPGKGQSSQQTAGVDGEEEQALQVEEPPRAPRLVGHHESDEEEVHGQARRASHPRRDEDGQEAFPFARNGPGTHDGGDGTGKSAEEGNGRASIEPQGPHPAVVHEGHAGHVAALLEGCHSAEEQGNLWHENDHPADAREQAVDQQIGPPPGVKRSADSFHQAPHARVDEVHWPSGPGIDGLENQEEDRHEDDGSSDAVGEDAVEPAAQRVGGGGRVCEDGLGNAPDILAAAAGFIQLHGRGSSTDSFPHRSKGVAGGIGQPIGVIPGGHEEIESGRWDIRQGRGQCGQVHLLPPRRRRGGLAG